MKFIRELYIAGKTIMVKEKHKRKKSEGQKRSPKTMPTTEQVWEANLRQAIFRLTLILNTNFKPGDWNLELTFAEELAIEEVKMAKDRFTRKLRDLCQKEGILLKWVIVPHIAGKKYHFHLICNQEVPLAIIKKAWVKGHVFEKSHLWDNPNYYRLAFYLMHEARALKAKKDEEEIPFTKRFSTSRTCVMPDGKREEIARGAIESDPKPFKGYLIDGEVQQYENLINGAPCREYIQVSYEEEPRIRKWYKGTMTTGERMPFVKMLREAYKEYQESMFDSLTY